MSNHVHLIVVPRRSDALAQALKHTHGRYASYCNVSHTSSGHVWQGRYYSCPLDSSHLWEALRYTELNPVRAGLVWYPRNGNGPAPLCTAAPLPGMRPWRRSRGQAAGLFQIGESISRPENRKPIWLLSDNARTRADHWDRQNSSRLWKSRCIALWLRKREVVPKNPSPTAGNTSSPFDSWWQNYRETSRLSPSFPRVSQLQPHEVVQHTAQAQSHSGSNRPGVGKVHGRVLRLSSLVAGRYIAGKSQRFLSHRGS